MTTCDPGIRKSLGRWWVWISVQHCVITKDVDMVPTAYLMRDINRPIRWNALAQNRRNSLSCTVITSRLWSCNKEAGCLLLNLFILGCWTWRWVSWTEIFFWKLFKIGKTDNYLLIAGIICMRDQTLKKVNALRSIVRTNHLFQLISTIHYSSASPHNKVNSYRGVSWKLTICFN